MPNTENAVFWCSVQEPPLPAGVNAGIHGVRYTYNFFSEGNVDGILTTFMYQKFTF